MIMRTVRSTISVNREFDKITLVVWQGGFQYGSRATLTTEHAAKLGRLLQVLAKRQDMEAMG